MKVLFTIDSLQQGGTEQSTAQIIKYLSKNVHVTVLYFYPKSDLLSIYKEIGCDIVSLELNGKYNWIKAIKGLIKTIENIKPDIVISSLYRSNIISRIACKICGKKLVGTFVTDSYNRERKNTFKNKGIAKYFATYLLDWATSSIPCQWISNSSIIAKNNAKNLGIPISKVNIIHRGRNSEEFKEWKPNLDQPFVFIAIGRLYEKKGYAELINAFSKVTRLRPHIKLEIFGEGEYRSNMEQSISDLNMTNHIILHGNIPNAWKKIYDANCFVLPSRNEGFNGSLVEAMMTGIPIICSDIPVNLEAVGNNQTALTFKKNNVEDLIEKMSMMINEYDKMILMGKRARLYSFEKFDIKKIAKQYEEILFKLVKKEKTYSKT